MLDLAFIKQYLVDPNKQPKHSFYEDSVMIAKHLQYHSKGTYPKDLIEIVRPNENQSQKDYRQAVYSPKTKTYFSKVVTTLAKIQRAEDWSVEFNDSGNAFEEKFKFEDYCTKEFPYFDSVTNWFFSVILRQMCDDPNGVIAVLPLPKVNPDDDSELLQPFTFWYDSQNVVDYQENKYCVLRSSEISAVIGPDGKSPAIGAIYYFLDSDSWTCATQIGNIKDYTFTIETVPHWIGYMPALKIGGIIEEFKNGEKLYDSFLGDCIPSWDEALRRYSDQQVQMVLHVHSEKWEIEDSPCKVCNETGMVYKNGTGTGNVNGAKIPCSNCGGTGCVSNRSPFNVKTIKPARQVGLNESINVPTPPMGYIQKPISDTQFIKDQVFEDIEAGLAAINMEFIMDEPANNSGVAKTIDRQEVNSFFYEVARHIVNNVLNPIYYFMAKWRYGIQLSEDEIDKTIPVIKEPTKFDILTEDILSARLQAATAAGVDPSLRMALQIEWAKREFGDNSPQVQLIECVNELDPLPAKNDQDKMTILSNKGVSQENYILSCNLSAFIVRASEENEEFFEMDYDAKMQIMNEYVTGIMDAQAAKQVPIIIYQNASPVPPGQGSTVTGNDSGIDNDTDLDTNKAEIDDDDSVAQ